MKKGKREKGARKKGIVFIINTFNLTSLSSSNTDKQT